MKQLFLIILLALTKSFLAQSLPVVSEPPVHVLYKFYPNLVQLSLSNYDYKEYILVNDSMEVLLHDKNGIRLSPNNFIVKIPWLNKMDSVHFELFDRSNMQESLKRISFKIISPPDAVVFIDNVLEGGRCSKHPLIIEASAPIDAPVKISYAIEFWTMEIEELEVFGKGSKFDDYAYSVLDKFPSGTLVKFRCRIIDELEYAYYHEAKFYLE